MFKSSEPICFCFCGPAASGKTSICHGLLREEMNLFSSISTTSRGVRKGEVDGRDYYFVSVEEFEKRVALGSFIEHATYSGNRYGTEKVNIELSKKSGKDLLLDIDVEGVRQLKQIYGVNVVTIFVFPPSMTELKRRLEARGTEDLEQVRRRLERAEKEMEILSSPEFSDYLLINDVLSESVAKAKTIVLAERHRLSRFSVESLKALRA